MLIWDTSATAIYALGRGWRLLEHQSPFDILKIGRSFTRDLGTSEEAGLIVNTIAALGKSLKREVIAEGIETPEQLALLAGMHCDYGQGYLFGRPTSAQEFTSLCRAWESKKANSPRHAQKLNVRSPLSLFAPR